MGTVTSDDSFKNIPLADAFTESNIVLCYRQAILPSLLCDYFGRAVLYDLLLDSNHFSQFLNEHHDHWLYKHLKKQASCWLIIGFVYSVSICCINIFLTLHIEKKKSITVLKSLQSHWHFLFLWFIQWQELREKRWRHNKMKERILWDKLFSPQCSVYLEFIWILNIHIEDSVTNSLVNIPFLQTNSWIHQSAIQFALSWALEIMENLLWFTFNSFLTYTYYGFTIIYLWCWISPPFFFFSFTRNHNTIVSLNYNTVSFPFKSEFTL